MMFPRPFALIFLLLLLLGATWCKVQGQYALDETGISIGGGGSFLSGDGMRIQPAYNIHFFFSHYTCGKKFGFHFEGGYRGMNSPLYGLYRPTEDPIRPIPRIFFNVFEVGAFYKMRQHTYHRPREMGFLIGPKLGFSGLYFVSNDEKSFFESEAAARNGKVSAFLPALHFSGWIRRPMGNDHALYIRPGIDFSPFQLYEVTDYNFNCFYLFLNLGIQFWNNH